MTNIQEPQPMSLKTSIIEFIGDIESLMSVITFIYMATKEVRVAKLKVGVVEMIVLLAIGVGFAVAAIRYGSILGKSVGWFSVAIHSLVILVILYANRVPWKTLRTFWNPILF